LIFGKTVVAIRISDSSTSVATITLASTLSQPGLRHGPSTSRSLHSSSRKTVALGSSTPASACTAVVITPSGAWGISTIAAGAGDQQEKIRRSLGVAKLRCSELLVPNTSPKA
jgi:hypothetical protein